MVRAIKPPVNAYNSISAQPKHTTNQIMSCRSRFDVPIYETESSVCGRDMLYSCNSESSPRRSSVNSPLCTSGIGCGRMLPPPHRDEVTEPAAEANSGASR